jgi:hypothetical protein
MRSRYDLPFLVVARARTGARRRICRGHAQCALRRTSSPGDARPGLEPNFLSVRMYATRPLMSSALSVFIIARHFILTLGDDIGKLGIRHFLHLRAAESRNNSSPSCRTSLWPDRSSHLRRAFGSRNVAAQAARPVVAVEMWEPTFDAGFQAPGKGSENPVWDSPRLTWHVISTANLAILPILVRSGHWALPKSKTSLSKKPRRLHSFTDCCAAPFF